MASALNPRIQRLGFEAWLGTLCCVLGQDTFITLIVLLSTQVYKQVLMNNFNAGGNPAMD